MEQPIEQVIPNMVLLAKVGEGSYGAVYLARSIIGQYRAVKIVHKDALGSTEAFDREFQGARRYEPLSRKHDGLIDILDVGRVEQKGIFYYVMDAADDERQGRTFDPATYRPRTLRYELTTKTAFSVEECIATGLDLASALMFLQDNGLVHRDIKPSNIVYVDGKVQLADIGLVVDVHEATSRVGTQVYAPPEGHGSFAGDVYSLGMVLYELLTGRCAADNSGAPVDEADTADPRFARLLAIIHKACAQNPQDRYQTAKGLFKALQELECVPAKQPPGAMSQRRIAAVAAVVVAVSVLGIRACAPGRSVDPPAINRTASDYLPVGEWRWRWVSGKSPATITFQFRTDGSFKAYCDPDYPLRWPGLGFVKKGEGTWSCFADILTVEMTHVEVPLTKFRMKHRMKLIDQQAVISASEDTIELSGTTDNMLVRTQ